MNRSDPLVIGLMFGTGQGFRPEADVRAECEQLAAVDPRIEVLAVPYTEPGELRGRRGATPHEDLSHLAPELTAEQLEAFARVEVVLALDLPHDVTVRAPKLKWVQGSGAGVSQLTACGLAEAGVRLTTAAGVNAVSISEFVIGRLLQMWKRFPELDASAADHRWQPAFGREITGLTLGVVGLGAIGRNVARRGRGMGLSVIAQRRTALPGQRDPDVDDLLTPDRLLELAARSDAVVAAAPETPATINLFDAVFFAAMREGALFVNVGRGSAVDEDALAAALRSGHLAGAALDVVRDEPLSTDSPLWDVPRLLISPHSATSITSYFPNLHRLLRDNVRRYLDGAPLVNEVDPADGF